MSHLHRYQANKIVVNNYDGKYRNQSKTYPVTLKVTSDEKEETQGFCFKKDLSVSEFYRYAGRILREMCKNAETLNMSVDEYHKRSKKLFHKYHNHDERLESYSTTVFALLDDIEKNLDGKCT